MAFDGVVTKAIVKELKQELQHGKITKIYQPFPNELILVIRAHGENKKVLLSAHPMYARVHITKEQYDNPLEPPMFCMVLRKHIEGSILENIEQTELERIIDFRLQTRNEIGDISYKTLTIEIMGKHSNIILRDDAKNTIIDSIKHIPPSLSAYRTVLPGYEYIAPPSHGKINPLFASEEVVEKKIDYNSGKIDKQLIEHFMGISPLLAKEITEQAGLGKNIATTFVKMMARINNEQFHPTIYRHETKEIFYVLPLQHVKGEAKSIATASLMLDEYFFGKAERDRVKQQANDLERFVINEKNKNIKKIKKLEAQLEDAAKADKYQLYGELLTAHMHLVSRGDKKAEVQNYYDDAGGTVVIPLQPQLTPAENAQKYYQKYTKLKNSVQIVIEQIEIAKKEIEYFETLLVQLQTAAPKDIDEIREELIQEGYLKKRKKRDKKKQTKPALEKYISSDGTEIYVGKNNTQNDYLTNKFARRNEIWLHTKDIPGSHVVIRSEEPTEQTILEAGQIAAYFSKARDSSNVPVDYTQIRHVKKPSGAKPGFVIYEHQTTIYVTPNKDTIMKLRSQ